jgi:hypothetical protein
MREELHAEMRKRREKRNSIMAVRVVTETLMRSLVDLGLACESTSSRASNGSMYVTSAIGERPITVRVSNHIASGKLRHVQPDYEIIVQDGSTRLVRDVVEQIKAALRASVPPREIF